MVDLIQSYLVVARERTYIWGLGIWASSEPKVRAGAAAGLDYVSSIRDVRARGGTNGIRVFESRG